MLEVKFGQCGVLHAKKEKRGMCKLISIFTVESTFISVHSRFSCILQGRGALDRDDEVNTFISLINSSSLWIHYQSLLQLLFVITCLGVHHCVMFMPL